MNEALANLRIEIDDVDQRIQELLTKRAKLAEKVGKVKQQESNPIFYRPQREKEILKMVAQRNNGPLSDEELATVFRLILSTCRNLQVKQHTKNQLTHSFEKVVIIGLGLIGCSIAKCLKETTTCTITGIDSNQQHLKQASTMKLVDKTSDDFKDLKAIDLIIICTPANSVSTIIKQLAPHLNDTVTITDVASTKAIISEQAQEILGDKITQFIPSHPLAGKEASGPSAADSKLFVNRKVLLTPIADSNEHSLNMVNALWQHCGAQTQTISPQQHDQALALTSHLPQMLSFVYMTCFESCIEYKKYGAGSFADFTRIAASNPAMWQAICSNNKKNILTAIQSFKEKLSVLENHIANGDDQALISFFELANAIKKENS